MKTHNTAWCPECQEVFPYNHQKPACISCTNTNIILLSRILDRKEEHHVKDAPGPSVVSDTKLDHLPTDDSGKANESADLRNSECSGEETRKDSWREKAVPSRFLLCGVQTFRSVCRVFNIAIQYGEQLQRLGSVVKGVQGIDADSPRSVLSRR